MKQTSNLHNFFETLLFIAPPFRIASIEDLTGSENKIIVNVVYDTSDKIEPENHEFVRIHEWEDHTWEHLRLFQYQCFIHCRLPKIKYRNKITGKLSVQTLSVPWAVKFSRSTKLFEQSVMQDIQRTGCVAMTSEGFDLYDNKVWRIFNRYTQGQIYLSDNVDYSQIKRIGYDENSIKKGQSYNTYFYDMDKKKLIGIQEGRSIETVQNFVEKAKERGFNPEKITDVSIDMSNAYTSSANTCFVNSKISYDRFHVSQLVLKAFDKARMDIAKKLKTSFNKWVFLKPKLDIQEYTLREELLDKHPELTKLYEHKEQFFQLWSLPQSEATGFLYYWADKCGEFTLKSIKTLGQTILSHFEGIIHTFTSKLSNGLIEGLNEKIQTMKRVARGYKHNTTLMKMVWLHCNNAIFSTQLE